MFKKKNIAKSLAAKMIAGLCLMFAICSFYYLVGCGGGSSENPVTVVDTTSDATQQDTTWEEGGDVSVALSDVASEDDIALDESDESLGGPEYANRFYDPLNPSYYRGGAKFGTIGASNGHLGDDVGKQGSGNSCGKPIYATANGKVVAVLDIGYEGDGCPGKGSGWGNAVLIEHTLPNGVILYSQYAHMQKTPSVKVGGTVTGGSTIIGDVGSTGNTGAQHGDHLHFEIKKFTGSFSDIDYPWGPGYSGSNFDVDVKKYTDSYNDTTIFCRPFSMKNVSVVDQNANSGSGYGFTKRFLKSSPSTYNNDEYTKSLFDSGALTASSNTVELYADGQAVNLTFTSKNTGLPKPNPALDSNLTDDEKRFNVCVAHGTWYGGKLAGDKNKNTWKTPVAFITATTYSMQTRLFPDSTATNPSVAAGQTAMFNIALSAPKGTQVNETGIATVFKFRVGPKRFDLAKTTVTVKILNSLPVVTITEPTDKSTYLKGSTVTFKGSATDANDGTLTGSSLSWGFKSDQGDVNDTKTGEEVSYTFNNADKYTITLTATDKNGGTAQASIRINVCWSMSLCGPPKLGI